MIKTISLLLLMGIFGALCLGLIDTTVGGLAFWAVFIVLIGPLRVLLFVLGFLRLFVPFL